MSNRLAAAVWGRAFSESEGDTAKAQALYIKLRVEQLSRLLAESSTEEYLRQLWPEISRGEAFVCPCCKRGAKLEAVKTDFFVKLFTGAPSMRYHCTTCKEELATERSEVGGGGTTATAGRVSAGSPTKGLSNSPLAVIGFILGLLSVVLYTIGIIPILAIVFSGIGLVSFKPDAQKNKWMAGVGLALGVVYTIMMLSHYGHLK